MSALLSIRNLSVGLVRGSRVTELLSDINLEIMPGETVGLVGESGSGKSLTALMALGLITPPLKMLGGSVWFDGTDLSRLSEKERHELRGRQIGIIFQDPLTALNPTLTIGAQIMDVVRSRFSCSRTEAYRRAIDAMRSVGITSPEERMNAYPHQMSGGMRQRILIAMVVQGRPKLIVADEPTTALDVTVQARVIGLLRAMQQSTGAALVFISHNLDLVAEFCDKIVVLYGGRVMEYGSSKDVIESSRHPYTRALLHCIPRLNGERGQLKVIPGQLPSGATGFIEGCPFAVRCARAIPTCYSALPERFGDTNGHGLFCWNPEPVQ